MNCFIFAHCYTFQILVAITITIIIMICYQLLSTIIIISSSTCTNTNTMQYYHASLFLSWLVHYSSTTIMNHYREEQLAAWLAPGASYYQLGSVVLALRLVAHALVALLQQYYRPRGCIVLATPNNTQTNTRQACRVVQAETSEGGRRSERQEQRKKNNL